MPVATPDIDLALAAPLTVEATPLNEYLSDHVDADRAKFVSPQV